MIKSTKTTLKFSNIKKLEQLHLFIDEYRNIVKQFVDILWEMGNIPKLLPNNITSQIETWLSARAIQCAGKQASGIVRGTRKKQEKRLYVYNKLQQEGKYKQARKLKATIDKVKITKPDINQICPEIDSRFIKQDWSNITIFDGWITLSSLGNKLKIKIPVKKSKHFNKLLQWGKIKTGIRLSKHNITFNFDMPVAKTKSEGDTVGLDIGIKNVFTLSNGTASQPDIHNHTLDSINKKLARKKKGSKAFLKAQQHRTNYINWSLNQINFDNVQTLKVENIKYIRKFKRTSRYLSHFTYTTIFNKLEDLTQTNGVRLVKVNPTYTSQRCSSCGWVCSRNRKGKQFKCVVCKYEEDADLNASRNILANLLPIRKTERLLHRNKKGFYWNEAGKECIVSSTQKPK